MKKINLSLIIALIMGITACSEEPATTPAKPSVDKTKTNKAKQSKPTNLYDFESWKKTPLPKQSINTNALLGVIGLSHGKNKKTLDYYGEGALSYQLRGNDLVFFNLIDSPKLIEINWFKAVPEDSKDIQNKGQDNAEKAYHSARTMLGERGGSLIQDIMTNKNGGSSVTHEKLVNATCEAFLCRLVVAKNGTNLVSGQPGNDKAAEIMTEKDITNDTETANADNKKPVS